MYLRMGMIPKSIFIFWALLIPSVVSAQELETILAKVREALGNPASNVLYAEGEINALDEEHIPFIFRSRNPDMARMDFTSHNTLETVIRRGNRSWLSNPYSALLGASYNEAEQLALQESFLFENNLLYYKERGLEVLYEGTVEVEGQSLWVLRIVGFSHKEELYYISQEDYLPVEKQSYLNTKGTNCYVSFRLKKYAHFGDVRLPTEVLVNGPTITSELHYLSFFFDEDIEKGVFVDANEPDYVTNILNFDAIGAKEYVHQFVPLSRAMGLEIEALSNQSVQIKAPISNNRNIYNGATSASVDRLFLFLCYTYLKLVSENIEPDPEFVFHNAETTFLRPITSDFSAKLLMPPQKEVRRLLRELKRKGTAQITLDAQIRYGDEIFVAYSGQYSIVKSSK